MIEYGNSRKNVIRKNRHRSDRAPAQHSKASISGQCDELKSFGGYFQAHSWLSVFGERQLANEQKTMKLLARNSIITESQPCVWMLKWSSKKQDNDKKLVGERSRDKRKKKEKKPDFQPFVCFIGYMNNISFVTEGD